MNVIHIRSLFFKYKTDQNFTLNIHHFSANKGDRIFCEGPSGCGKTTFLNILTGLTAPNRGDIDILNTDITRLSNAQCDRFRADHFGIIFQLFNLIPYLSVIENIILPCLFSKIKKEKACRLSSTLEQEAKRLCVDLDIDRKCLQSPVQNLSIGQQQRVAIARSLMGQPEIIVADEPTSALDNDRKEKFISLLLNECEKYNTTLIFVSHDTALKSKFDRMLKLQDLNTSKIERECVSI